MPVRIVGPTGAHYMGQIGRGGTSSGPYKSFLPYAVVSDGRRFVVFKSADATHYVWLDAVTMRRRSVRSDCILGDVGRGAFLVRCGSTYTPMLLFPRSGRLRPVRGVQSGEAVVAVGRYWIEGAILDHSCDTAESGCVPEDDTFWIYWRTGKRILCPFVTKYRGFRCDNQWSGWDLDHKQLRPQQEDIAIDGQYVLDHRSGQLVLRWPGYRKRLSTTPGLLTCVEILVARLATWVPGCDRRRPTRIYAYDIRAQRRLRWTISGELRPPDVDGGYMDFARTRKFVWAAVLSAVGFTRTGNVYPSRYALFAIPLTAG